MFYVGRRQLYNLCLNIAVFIPFIDRDDPSCNTKFSFPELNIEVCAHLSTTMIHECEIASVNRNSSKIFFICLVFLEVLPIAQMISPNSSRYMYKLENEVVIYLFNIYLVQKKLKW